VADEARVVGFWSASGSETARQYSIEQIGQQQGTAEHDHEDQGTLQEWGLPWRKIR